MQAGGYRDGRLHVEDVAVADIAAEYGTPCYVYSTAAIRSAWRAVDAAFSPRAHLVCYSVKANPNLGVLSLLARLGSGFDIVSAGELERVLHAGGDPARTIFAGVGKGAAEIERALEVGIRCFSAESAQELERIAAIARALGVTAPVALRVNPDVDPATHPYIATGLHEHKFGIPAQEARALVRQWHGAPGVSMRGLGCHIGSQVQEVGPFRDAVARLVALAGELAGEGVELHHLDIGGGLGIRYRDEAPPTFEQWAAAVLEAVPEPRYELLLEPGRSIVGPAGLLLTRVEYIKRNAGHGFAVVDAAMTELLRPALYGAWHEVRPAVAPRGAAPARYDIVGPVCESADWLARDRELALAPGDLLAFSDTGAYGASMGSSYNSRPRPPEIMVSGADCHLVRRRETLEELFALEQPLPPGA